MSVEPQAEATELGVHAEGVRWTRPAVSEGGRFEKMYHVIGDWSLDQALSEGLVPGTAQHDAPALTGDGMQGEAQEHVYLWDTPETALRYALHSWGMMGELQHVVEVRVTGMKLERDPYFDGDPEAAHRWRGPTGEVGAYRVIEGTCEPRTLVPFFEVDTDDESAYDPEQLYGQDPRNWPEGWADPDVQPLTPKDLPPRLEAIESPATRTVSKPIVTPETALGL